MNMVVTTVNMVVKENIASEAQSAASRLNMLVI